MLLKKNQIEITNRNDMTDDRTLLCLFCVNLPLLTLNIFYTLPEGPRYKRKDLDFILTDIRRN